MREIRRLDIFEFFHYLENVEKMADVELRVIVDNSDAVKGIQDHQKASANRKKQMKTV